MHYYYCNCNKMNDNKKKFKPVQNSENAETTAETIFEYKQNGTILTSEYSGDNLFPVI